MCTELCDINSIRENASGLSYTHTLHNEPKGRRYKAMDILWLQIQNNIKMGEKLQVAGEMKSQHRNTISRRAHRLETNTSLNPSSVLPAYPPSTTDPRAIGPDARLGTPVPSLRNIVILPVILATKATGSQPQLSLRSTLWAFVSADTPGPPIKSPTHLSRMRPGHLCLNF